MLSHLRDAWHETRATVLDDLPLHTSLVVMGYWIGRDRGIVVALVWGIVVLVVLKVVCALIKPWVQPKEAQ